ncbi:MAG: HNH endonuclease [Candidatus Brocadiae bacterium]|nr:HNH endonuclease [Candidatus Brocadiia bacterium]
MPLPPNLRERLQKLHRDTRGGWSDATRGGAPHKPILLLAVMDLIEAGVIRENAIAFDERLLSVFDQYWTACRGDLPTNPLQPFWYLKGDGIWRHVPRPGQKQVLDALTLGGRVPPRRRFQEIVAGARLDPELFEAMKHAAGRAELRRLLFGRYFGDELQAALAARHGLVVESVHCESALRRRLERELADLFAGDGALGQEFTEEGRSMAFRAVVVEAYGHTCAVCGARVRTPSGRSAVQAAHIVPFSVCRNNDPRNGLALCPLHHWAFDQGMLGVTDAYAVKVHAYAEELPADEGFRALKGRGLRLPADGRIHPAPVALEWHRRHVFQGAG